jgi:hypothetical protein
VRRLAAERQARPGGEEACGLVGLAAALDDHERHALSEVLIEPRRI